MNVSGTHVPAKKIVIVGGVAGGMSAAARLRRISEASEIIVFERSGHVSYANCGLPYFLGGEIKSKNDLLVQTPTSLKARLNLDIRVLHEVVEVDPQGYVCILAQLPVLINLASFWDGVNIAGLI